MDENLIDLGEHIASELQERGVTYDMSHDELTLHTDADNIIDVLRFLRDDASCQFVCFIDICGVDYPAREKRFDVVYHLLSLIHISEPTRQYCQSRIPSSG